ncbi:MAG: restriction endonuclease subunit S [Negativibacillus massiliensis]|nr:restriction endonuclease subunit S [Negativibacillus massiliensis]
MEKMKASGTDYLLDIPSSWDIRRFKYCVQICNGAEYSDIEVEEGGFPVIGSGGEFARASKYCYNGESVLLGRKGTIDKPLYVNDAFWCVDTMFYTKVKPQMVARYLYYCTLCFRFDYYVTATALPSMTQKDLGSEKVACPSRPEQKAIADFLDAQCSKIDGIIADLEKQIELLQKYKKSLITETVTKGLDKSAPMKDSGIEWIGEIPITYTVRRLKYLTEIKDGTHDTPDYVEEAENTYPLITPRYINYDTGKIEFSEAKHISNADFQNIYRRSNVSYGDIIMPMIGTIGNPVIVDTYDKFAIKNVALFKTGNDIVSAKFLLYQFYSDHIIEQFSLSSRGGVQAFISMEILGNLQFVDCDRESKVKIVEYLDRRITGIDDVINLKRRQILLIQKDKKSLIYEYVTGKKRVKEVG